MPNHVHAIIAFRKTDQFINTIIANGKRFMAYDLIRRLKLYGMNQILDQLASWVNKSQKQINKQQEVFEPSFEQKECFNLWFLKQKTDYIHLNPCKKGLAVLPEDYEHSSASYYFTGLHRNCAVITYMELQDIDLGGF